MGPPTVTLGENRRQASPLPASSPAPIPQRNPMLTQALFVLIFILYGITLYKGGF